MLIRRLGLLLVLFLIVAVLSAPGLFDDLFALVFIGIMPHSQYVIPSQIMFAIYALLIALGLRALIALSTTIFDAHKHDMVARKKARVAVYKKVHYTPPKQRRSRTRKHQRRTAEA